MFLFDTLKVMKDIVSGGIASYKAGEKLDELIEKVMADYGEELSTTQEKLYLKYERAKKAYGDNSDSNKTDSLLTAMENARIEFLESLEENSSLPNSLKNEIKTSVKEFKKADNMALDSLGEVLNKHAETDEQRAEIRKTLDESRENNLCNKR